VKSQAVNVPFALPERVHKNAWPVRSRVKSGVDSTWKEQLDGIVGLSHTHQVTLANHRSGKYRLTLKHLSLGQLP
jgi:hypothetical protein